MTQLTAVTQVDGISLESFHRRSDVHAPDRRLDDILDVSHGQAVSGNGVPVDIEIQVVTAHDTLGVNRQRARHPAYHRFDFPADIFQRL